MPDGPPLSRGRRSAVRGLLCVGTLLAVLAIAAVFVNRQALNADNWSDTSSALLEDEAIRTQVTAFLVDEVYTSVDVGAELAEALPPRLAPLAGPAAGALRTFSERTTERLLERPRVQQAWEAANRVSAEQFIAIVDGDSRAITRAGDAVVLDLRVILLDLVQRLGLPSSIGDRIPATAGRIEVMSDDQIDTARSGIKLLRGLALVLPILALGLLALAVALARGRRRRTLLHAGSALIVAGVAVLAARSIAGEQITSALASTDAVRPAADQTWAIGTRILRDVAQAVIIGAVPLIAAGLLAGPTRGATALRRRLAPWLRDNPAGVYGVAAALVALVVWWGPIPATQKVLPVLVMIALFALGIEVLRRQTAVEFPDEHRPVLQDGVPLTDEEFAVEKAANGSRV